MRERHLSLWLAIAAGVIVVDQATKLWVESALALGAAVYIAPVLDLVHVRNTGAAFSFLAGASGWQREHPHDPDRGRDD